MTKQTELDQLTDFFEITINGNPLSSEQLQDVQAVKYSDEINTPAMFELDIAIEHSDTLELQYIDSDMFKEGGEVKLKMGYGSETQEMMIGEITGIEPEFSEDKILTMIVRGYSRLHRLCRGKKSRSFKKMKDSQIAEKIAQEIGLTPKVEDTKVTYPYIFQNNLSNFEFLIERAHKIGYEISVNGKQFSFYKSPVKKSPVAELNFGDPEKNLIEFYPRLTTAFQLTTVEARYWDRKTKKEVVSTAKIGDETTLMDGQNSGASVTDRSFGEAKTIIGNFDMISQAEAETVAKAKFNDHVMSYIIGEGVCIGAPEVKAGSVVKLKGLGERFSGLYYVNASTHTIDERGYLTSFLVRRNAT